MRRIKEVEAPDPYDEKEQRRGRYARRHNHEERGMRLTRTLRDALCDGARRAGSYEADAVLSRVEERLTVQEYESAAGFLRWIAEGRRSFGHGNLAVLWEEWRRA